MGSEVLPMLGSGKVVRSSPPLIGAIRYIRFGAFILDQHREEIFKNGARLKLQGKAFQVLLALLERPGEVVTREELRIKLWPSDTHVNFDANVNTTVNKLRQALGDSREAPLYIETVPRKGYSFIATVEPSEAPTIVRAVRPDPSPAIAGSGAAAMGNSQQPSQLAGAEQLSPSSQDNNALASGLAALAAKRLPLWISVGVAVLIAIGMLLGASVAMYWMTHAAGFTPLH